MECAQVPCRNCDLWEMFHIQMKHTNPKLQRWDTCDTVCFFYWFPRGFSWTYPSTIDGFLGGKFPTPLHFSKASPSRTGGCFRVNFPGFGLFSVLGTTAGGGKTNGFDM